MDREKSYKIWGYCSWGAMIIGALLACIGGFAGAPLGVVLAGAGILAAGMLSWFIKIVTYAYTGKNKKG